MLCGYCRGHLKDGEQLCPFCGHNAIADRHQNSALDDRMAKNPTASAYIVLAGIFAPLMLFYFIFTLIFGEDPDKLMTCYIALIAISVVAVIIYGSILEIKQYKKAHAPNTKITTGEVVDFHQHSGMRPSYYPIIEFEVHDKKYRYVFDRDYGAEPAIGHEFDIVYNIHKPQECSLAKDHRGLKIIVVSLIAVGVIAAIAMIFNTQLTGGPLLKA
jgi:hypothetical protein